MNIPKYRFVLGTLALLTVTAFAAVVFQVRGNLAGTVSFTPINPTQARLAVNLGGQLSHLGKTRTVFETVADFSGPVPVAVSSNVGVITAANGDRILFTQRWKAAPLGGNRYDVTAIVQVAGGTGRFMGVTGNGTYRAKLDLNTGTAIAEIDGGLIR
ncbi:MAG: hypothetical protein K8R87_13480 [Verrucomicrobia bacterium]|nr:hypothetical protein [Verrucomicrobiota bacterium]